MSIYSRRRFNLDGNHAPAPPFELNEDSPQARELHTWFPLIDNNRARFEYLKGAVADTQIKRVWTPAPIIGLGSKNPSTTIGANYNGKYNVGSLSIPYTVSCLTYLTAHQDWSASIGSETTDVRFGLGNTGAGASTSTEVSHIDLDGNSFDVWGDVLPLNELILIGAIVRTTTDWSLYVVSQSAGFQRTNQTRAMGAGPTVIDSFTIGEDAWDLSLDRIWRGWIFDQRIISRAISDDEFFRMFLPQTRWDLYWQPGRVTYFVPAAAAIPHGPLGHPLHGPFGGPV